MSRRRIILAHIAFALVVTTAGIGIGAGIAALLDAADLTIPPQAALVILGVVAFAGLLTWLIAEDVDDQEGHR